MAFLAMTCKQSTIFLFHAYNYYIHKVKIVYIYTFTFQHATLMKVNRKKNSDRVTLLLPKTKSVPKVVINQLIKEHQRSREVFPGLCEIERHCVDIHSFSRVSMNNPFQLTLG